jgi:hypothetical protein
VTAFIGVLQDLAKARPLFHSEADLQHAYAWAIQTAHPDASVRLEYRHPAIQGRSYLDIWLELDGVRIGIELKYKTRAVRVEHRTEQYELLNQGAQDQGRYDFCRDVSRIERIVAADSDAHGLAVLLTNDSSYWTLKRSTRLVDDRFRLCEGTTLYGELDWLPHASAGTKSGRHAAIQIAGRYKLAWQHFSTIDAPRCNEFRFLALSTTAAQDG